MGVPDEPGVAFRVFSVMGKAKINVDNILQSAGKGHTNDISFTVASGDVEAAKTALDDYVDAIGFDHVSVDSDVAKVSVVGAGLMNASGMAVKIFEALSDRHINIKMISSSEIKLSVVIPEGEADAAVSAIHDKFFND